MPRSPAQPMPANASPALRVVLARIDRDCDPWFLPNFRTSIMGDAAIYVANERIRESALASIGITAREHGAVREALRGMLMCERRDAVAFRRLASMLCGERVLAGGRNLATTRRIARQFVRKAA